MMKTYDVSSLNDLDKVVSQFLPQFQKKEVIWLTGPLGIGKSEWVRRTLKYLGFHKPVPSPSFSLHNSYPIQNKWIHHIDLYRIQKDSDLESFPFYDLFTEPHVHCIFVEWANRIQMEKNLSEWNQLYVDFKWKNQKRILNIQKLSG